jgi:hypothetical protein
VCGGDAGEHAVADLAESVPECERYQAGQAERPADLLHGVLHPGRQARVLAGDLVQRGVDAGWEAQPGEHAQHDHPGQHPADV